MKFLKEKINILSKGGLAKVALLNGISSAVKIFTAFITTKIVAAIIGPAGVALTGQLSNFLAFIFVFATGGINGGVVKYTAEYRDSEGDVKYYISTSFWIAFVFSIIIGLGTIVCANMLSQTILYSSQYAIVFYAIGLTLCLYAINSIFLSVINGYKNFEKYTYVNISTSIFSLIVTIFLAFFFKVKGALLAIVLSQSLVSIVTFMLVRKEKWFNISMLLGWFKLKITTKLFKYSLMAIATALLVPTTQFLIRSYAITKFSVENAGIWEGMNKVSNMYLLVITTTLGIYFLPRFSEIKERSALKKEIFKAYKTVTPPLILICLLIFVSKDLIIRVVFTQDFASMKSLFFFQLMGDIMKIMTWILGTVMVSRAMYKLYIGFEIFTNGLLYFLSIYFSKFWGLQGLCLGYFVALLLTLFAMILVFRNTLFNNKHIAQH